MFFIFSRQKKKRQAAYDGIRYDKLGSSGEVSSASKANSTKLLISADDVNLEHEKLQHVYDEMQTVEDDEDDDEETHFINNSRSSFYTSSERT
jgi:hypothetical protein